MGTLRRRSLCSASTAESSWSSSRSSSCLIALGKSAGKTCRGEERWFIDLAMTREDEGGFPGGEEGSRADAGEDRSGVVGRVPMRRSCNRLARSGNGSGTAIPRGRSRSVFSNFSIFSLYVFIRICRRCSQALLSISDYYHCSFGGARRSRTADLLNAILKTANSLRLLGFSGSREIRLPQAFLRVS